MLETDWEMEVEIHDVKYSTFLIGHVMFIMTNDVRGQRMR
jgi:hypothetical protein